MFDEIIQSFKMDPGFLNICLRLLCAMLVGLVIGTEREYTNRPAGMRTHVLVALGACVVAITGMVLHSNYEADPGRLAAQVITGVGFLGAGTILRQGSHVKGLTTAASLWAVACLGIAAGFGFYAIAIAGMIFIFITLTILEFLQRRLIGDPDPVKDYIMEAVDLEAGLNALNTHAQKQTAGIQNIQVQRLDSGYRITFRGEIGGFRGQIRQQHFFTALAQDPAVTMLQTLDAEAVAQ